MAEMGLDLEVGQAPARAELEVAGEPAKLMAKGSASLVQQGEKLIKEGGSLMMRAFRPNEKKSRSRKMLHAEHKMAKGPITYEPNKPLQMLFRLHGTAFQMVLMRSDFYLLMLMHIVLSVTYWWWKEGGSEALEPDLAGWPHVSYTMLSIVGGAIVFFLVFFNNQAYKRFFEQYQLLRIMDQQVVNLGMMLRVNFRDGLVPAAKQTRQQCMRYITASQYLAVACLPPYKEDNVDCWAYDHFQISELLTFNEVARLKGLPSLVPRYQECHVWVLERLWWHVNQGHLESRIYQAYERNILELRRVSRELYNYVQQPIPFAYFHLLNLILLAYMVVVGYVFVFLAPKYSIIPYAIYAFSMLGLRELSIALADPFGDDSTDLPAFQYITELEDEHESSINLSPLINIEPVVEK